VLGHSAGGDMALAYALAHPHCIDSLICVAGGRIHNDRDWRKVYEWNVQHRADLLPRIAALPMPVHYVLADADIRPNWPLEQIAALAPRGQVHRIAGAAHNIWLTHAEPLRVALRHVLGLERGVTVSPMPQGTNGSL
jgi:proline iminopeptidase